MKDPYEVLRQKETDLARVRREIESLRTVAALLLDEAEAQDLDRSHRNSNETADSLDADSEADGTDIRFSSEAPRSRFWDALKRAR